jgi:hypothetical protein
MNSSSPNIINEISYPLYNANLAITSFYKSDGSFDFSAALKLIPSRVQDGQVEISNENSKSVLIGNKSEMQQLEMDAMNKIYAAIQEYILIKGL